jgi:putative heme iron utilization protein
MERQLDHAERNKVVAAYARSEHLAERVEMMEEWGRMVTVLEAGANVIELQRAA